MAGDKKAPKTDTVVVPNGNAVPTAETAPVEKEPDNSNKLKTFLGILRRFIGVSDLASIRFSLPAHLLEPTPNLGMFFWQRLVMLTN
jgi:hypothetical protein